MNTENMSLMEKMTQARLDLQRMNIKKTGWNEYSKYHYFQLADVLPIINELADKYRFFAWISYGIETASMTITDLDSPSSTLEIVSPMSTASLKASHEVQNLGAVQTYLRRYFYMTAFEIVEFDEIDATYDKNAPAQKKVTYHKTGTGSKPLPTKKADPDEHSLAMSPEQIKSLQTFAIQEYGDERAKDAYKWALQSLGIESSALLNKTDYDPVMDALRDYQPLPFGFGDEA